MEGQGRSFPLTRLTFQVRKVMGGVVVRWVACLASASCDEQIYNVYWYNCAEDRYQLRVSIRITITDRIQLYEITKV